MWLTLSIAFLIGYIPINKMFFFIKKQYYKDIQYFSFKEVVSIFGSSEALSIILLNLLKPIFIYYLLLFSDAENIYYWIAGFILLLGNLCNKETLKFRGTMFSIVYLFLLQASFIGTVLAVYIFFLAISRSQSKASVITVSFLIVESLYYLDLWQIIFFIIPTTIIIYYNYRLIRLNQLNFFTFFTLKNNI